MTSAKRVPLGTRWAGVGAAWGAPAGSPRGRDGAASLSSSSSMLPTPHTPALRGSLQGPSHRAGLAFEQHRAPTFLHSPVVRSRPIWTAGARLGLQHILPAAAQGAGCPFGEVCGVPAEQTAQPVQEVAWKQSMREQLRCGSGVLVTQERATTSKETAP